MSTVPNPTATERVSGNSLHRQVYLVLHDEITRGFYAESGLLPKEDALCERFGVSRITVRRALSDLAAKGLVERRQGLGTFVRSGPVERTNPSLGILDQLSKTARETQVKVIDVSHEVPPPDIAASLHIGPGERATHALRLRSSAGEPVMLTDAWVPLPLGSRVSAAALRKQALYEILMAQGVKFGRVVQETTAQAADPNLASWLKVELGAPILKLVRVMHNPEGQPVEFITVYLPPGRSRILTDYPGELVNTLGVGQVVHQ